MKWVGIFGDFPPFTDSFTAGGMRHPQFLSGSLGLTSCSYSKPDKTRNAKIDRLGSQSRARETELPRFTTSSSLTSLHIDRSPFLKGFCRRPRKFCTALTKSRHVPKWPGSFRCRDLAIQALIFTEGVGIL